MNPQPTPSRRNSKFLNFLLCYTRYRIQDLKYRYYDLVDEAHDTVSAHPVAAKQCGVALCGFLGGAVASVFFGLAFRHCCKRQP
jgi:hypothetical protein